MRKERRIATVNKPVETVPYGQTVIPRNRLKLLAEACRKALKRVPGNVLEVGIYRGGTFVQLAKAVQDICPQFQAFGIDTFLGHPYTDGHRNHPKGKYSDVDLGELFYFFNSQGLGNRIELFLGKVEEIFASLGLGNISFAHIDCDLYIPVKYCAENVPRVMNKGGVIFFDDYGHDHCPGATRAVEEVFSSEQINVVQLNDGTRWSCWIQV
jgi:O-methyltransferase